MGFVNPNPTLALKKLVWKQLRGNSLFSFFTSVLGIDKIG